MAQKKIPFPLPVKGLADDPTQAGTTSQIRDCIPYLGVLSSRAPYAVQSSVATSGLTVNSVGYRLFDSGGAAIVATGSAGNTKYYCATSASNWQQLTAEYIGGVNRVAANGGWVEVGDELFSRSAMDSTSSFGVTRWCGKTTARYYAGTAGVPHDGTYNSYYVTGNGTAWDSSHENCYISLDQGEQRRIVSVLSPTLLRVDAPFRQSYTNGTYAINPIGILTTGYMNTSLPNGGSMFNFAKKPDGTSLANSGNTGIPFGDAVGFHQGRLFIGGLKELAVSNAGSTNWENRPGRIRWSSLADEATYSGGAKGPSYFQVSAFMDIAPMGGIIGLTSFAGDLVVLCRQGVQLVKGNFASDGTYEGASVHVVAEHGGPAGKQSWDRGSDGVYWANNDGVFLWDGQQVVDLTSNLNLTWRNRNDHTYAPFVSSVGRYLIVRGYDTSTTPSYITWVLVKGDGWFEFYDQYEFNAGFVNTVPVYDSTGSLNAAYSACTSTSFYNTLLDVLPSLVGGRAADGTLAPVASTSFIPIDEPVRVNEVLIDYFATDSTSTTWNVTVDALALGPDAGGQLIATGSFTTPSTSPCRVRVPMGGGNASYVDPPAIRVTVTPQSPVMFRIAGVNAIVDVDDRYGA